MFIEGVTVLSVYLLSNEEYHHVLWMTTTAITIFNGLVFAYRSLTEFIVLKISRVRNTDFIENVIEEDNNNELS